MENLSSEQLSLRAAMRGMAGDAWREFRLVGGDPHEMAGRLELLSAEHIERPTVSPAELRSAVEPLVAWSDKAFVKLSRGWPRPRPSAYHLWWREVWRASARHLVRMKALGVSELDPIVHFSEIEILSEERGQPWPAEEAISAVRGMSRDDLRVAARRPIIEAHIPTALLSEASPEALRLMRDHPDKIDPAGRSLLAKRAMFAMTQGNIDLACTLAEVLRLWDDSVLPGLVRDLTSRLRRYEPSTSLLELCMVLASNWNRP